MAYRDILSIEHTSTEGLQCQQRKRQTIHNMIIMMALNVLREANDSYDTTGRVHMHVNYASRPRVEQLGGRYF